MPEPEPADYAAVTEPFFSTFPAFLFPAFAPLRALGGFKPPPDYFPMPQTRKPICFSFARSRMLRPSNTKAGCCIEAKIFG